MSDDGPTQPVDELLTAAYSLDGPDANRALYARWADTYESGFITDSRYIYHDQVAEVLAHEIRGGVAASDVIVDVGCGTGLAGDALRRRAAVQVDGIDISHEMLQQAATKLHHGAPMYRTLVEADLTQPLPIAADAYAGAISVGTFTHGHVGPAAIAEVVRVLRPGALAALGINAAHFETAGFGPILQGLVRAHQIHRLRLIDVQIYEHADTREPDNVGRVAIFEVT